MSSRILVTGAGGFIGSHLYARLLKERPDDIIVGTSRRSNKYWYDIDLRERAHLVYCDLTIERQVNCLMGFFTPDYVFHIAANPIVKENKNDPCEITEQNVLATHYLLSRCKPYCRFVYASSAAVYGDRDRRVSEFNAPVPNSVYGATKLAAEYLLFAYGAQGRVLPLALRLTTNVGSGATHGIVPDLVKKLRSNNDSLKLIGNASGSMKPYCHVSDTIEAFMHFGLNRLYVGVMNIGPDDSITVADVADTVMEAVQIRKPTVFCNEDVWPGDQCNLAVDSSMAIECEWNRSFNHSRDAVYQAVKDIIACNRSAF